MNRTRAEFLYWSRTAPQEGLYLGQLAWEFLRRNNEYRDLVAPYVAAAPRAVVLKEISAADRERVRSFGLAAAVNPSCPGWAFWPLYWHPDKVPMMATFKQILPPVETPKPAKEIFYYRPQLPRASLRLLFETWLDDLGVAAEPKLRVEDFYKYRYDILAYDLWFERHTERGGDLKWRELGILVEAPLNNTGAGHRARDYQKAALRLIGGGYLDKLLQDDITVQTGVKLPVSPAYLGEFHHPSKNPFL